MTKYFTMSFDDGVEQDKEIIRILENAGLNCCTFNLNSSLTGIKQAVGCIGGGGKFEEKLINGKMPRSNEEITYVEQFRIPKDEWQDVYGNFEVACHGAQHKAVSTLTGKELEREIFGDKAEIEQIFGKSVYGYVYPFGTTSGEAERLIKNAGFLYTRGVASTYSFAVPQDFIRLQPTCRFNDPRVTGLLDEFISSENPGDRLFYIWGHAYELDLNMGTGSCDHLKRLLEKVATRSDIVCASNAECLKALNTLLC